MKHSAKIRCAKWCGRGCTEAEYQQARKEAKQMVTRLGKGWRSRVWENLGWHWRVELIGTTVTLSGGGHYWTAYLLDNRIVVTGRTPERTIRNALPVLRREQRMAAGELVKCAFTVATVRKVVRRLP